MKKSNMIISIFILLLIINITLYPSIYISQSLNGINIWALNVLPSLLPFMILSKLLISLGFIDKITPFINKPFSKFFKSPKESSYIFLISILSGYPIGAKLIGDLYSSNKISRIEAFKMHSFCSTSGPMFILGVIGSNMLNNLTYGYIILISHILGAVLNGLLFSRLNFTNLNTKIIAKKSAYSEKVNTNNFSSIILDSSLSIICVGSIISIFFIITTFLSPIFNLFPTEISSVFKGLIEITNGCNEISNNINNIIAIPLITFILSFGGLSTIIQSFSMLDKTKIPCHLLILQKISHAIFATFIATIIILFLPI